MQVYTKPDRQPIKTGLFFLLLLFIAYLPVSTFLFFIKNDAFNGYFPPKFFISESIQAGQLPLWNPYINYGLPQYADMSSSFWSPITWLFAGIPGYNAYSFTVEILLYILLSGTGMYKLCRSWPLSRLTSFAAGTSYLCCGYISAHLQHFNWLTGAAFLPWSLWALRNFQHKPSLKNILVAVLLFYLLLSSSHPGIIIGAFYFFSAWTLFDYSSRRNQVQRDLLKNYISPHVLFLLLLVMISAGMLFSYIEILPHITRGVKPVAESSDLHPMSFQSWISLLYPLSTVKNDELFNTDLSMRNAYFGLGMLIFFITGLVTKKTKAQNFFLITGFLFLFISATGVFKDFAYRFMPLIGYVRMSGEFALFTQFAFIMFAALQLDKFINSDTGTGTITRVINALLLIDLLVLITALILIPYRQESIFYLGHGFDSISGITAQVKFLIDNLSFYDCLLIQSLIQLIFLLLLRSVLIGRNIKLFLWILIGDMVIATLMNLPFTGVGQTSVSEVQKVIKESPTGLPAPLLRDPRLADTISQKKTGLVGNWNFYNKQIGPSSYVFYPIELKHTRSVYNDTMTLYKPWLYSSRHAIKISEYEPEKISLLIDVKSSDTITLKQNYYPHWFYNKGNGWEKVIKADKYFIGVPVGKGDDNVEFSFRPSNIKLLMAVTAALLLGFITLICYLCFRKEAKLTG